MSSRASHWVWETSATRGIDRLVMLAVADEASDTGRFSASIATLTRKTGVDSRTVQRALQRLTQGPSAELTLLAGQVGPRGTKVYRILLDPRAGIVTPPADDHRHTATPDTLPPGTQSPPRQAATQVVQEPRTKEQTTSSSPVPAAPAPIREDVERICAHLADRIAGNDEDGKRPAVGKRWRDAARLMLDRDNRPEPKIHLAIDWCQDSEFWRGNILSMPKLREKYSTLQQQARRPAPAAPAPVRDFDAERAQQRVQARRQAPIPGWSA